MANKIYSLGFYGDIHLASKNYGAHRDYPKESLYYFREITKVVEKRGLTHLVGAGDFTYGRFHSLEYRLAIEAELEKQYKLTNGNRYELRGNHDEAGYGLTERDYYVQKGFIKASENLTLGNLNITMVDYGKMLDTEPNIIDDTEHVNIIFGHDFYYFKTLPTPAFGNPLYVDNYEKWFGVDYICCGHIHKIMDFKGFILKNGMVHDCKIHYMGCMTRPSYQQDLDKIGQILIIDVYDDGKIDLGFEDIELWELTESFNLELKNKEEMEKEERASRVDITDIVNQLDAHDRSIGSPDAIIDMLQGIDERYKVKAKNLLKDAMG